MNIQLLSNNNELTQPIHDFFIKKNGVVHITDSINGFFKSCAQVPSNVFMIQVDIDTETQVLDFLKDLRIYFGAFPLIFIIGKKQYLNNSTLFLNVGADNTLTFPYDMPLLEDFLGHRLQRDVFLPINYRNIPSGGSPIKVSRLMSLTQIRSNGIEFDSPDFISRGTFFNFNLGNYIKTTTPSIRCKLISSTNCIDNDELYSYQAEFYNVDIDTQKEIRFLLKNS